LALVLQGRRCPSDGSDHAGGPSRLECSLLAPLGSPVLSSPLDGRSRSRKSLTVSLDVLGALASGGLVGQVRFVSIRVCGSRACRPLRIFQLGLAVLQMNRWSGRFADTGDMILVTGAGGQVGRAVVREFREAGHEVLAADVGGASETACDVRSEGDVARLFEGRRIGTVVHLAAVLPTAYRADPVYGAAVNLEGTLRLLRAAVSSGVGRFVFASSASVYGSAARRGCTEAAGTAPDDGYGAAKVEVEKNLERMAGDGAMETVSLRIARVLGPGAGRTASGWRSRMFERAPARGAVLAIPFAAEARVTVIHVEDLARALRVVAEAEELARWIYNAPAEVVMAGEMAAMAAEFRGWRVEMGSAEGGPEVDSGRFEEEFRLRARRVREHFERG
jgi:UDP-glucose 4-epimerase